jgi:hypothetical protein
MRPSPSLEGERALAGQRAFWGDLERGFLRGWRLARAHPLTVALVVLLFYGASIWLSFHIQRQNPRDWATIGANFVQKGAGSSPIITRDLQLAHINPGPGYDGQFNYFIALDPLGSARYIDDPPLRYERILYPLAASALALGDPARVPYTLVIVNWLAMVGGALGLAYWLRRWSLSPWLALIYALFPGLYSAFRHDLSEPLAFAFTIWGILALGWARPRGRFIAAALCFALAALTREVTLFVSLPYILRLVWPEITREGWPAMRAGVYRAAGMLATAVGPFLVWKVILYGLFGAALIDSEQYLPFRAPFSGVFAYLPNLTDPQYQNQVLYVMIPGAVAAVAALVALIRSPDGWKPATVALGFNALYLCVFLAPQSLDAYISAGRIQSGIVLTAILALPVFDRLWLSRDWFWFASALWLAPLWFVGLYPVLLGYLVYLGVVPS